MNEAQRKSVRAVAHAANEVLKADKALRALDLSDKLYDDAIGEKIEDLINQAVEVVEQFEHEMEPPNEAS